MKKFWKNLAQVSKGQLFSGGYLSNEAVLRLAEERADEKKKSAIPDAGDCRAAWPRIAIPH